MKANEIRRLKGEVLGWACGRWLKVYASDSANATVIFEDTNKVREMIAAAGVKMVVAQGQILVSGVTNLQKLISYQGA